MRGTWVVVCALAVAACNDGVIIEVRAHPDVPTKEVELFLGLVPCDDCGAIQPMGAKVPLAGEVYFRDGDEVFTARVDGDGSAWFRIQPTDVGSFLKTLVAVSAGQDAAAITFDLDLTTRDHWVMELQPVSSPLNVQGVDGEFVQVWREAADPKSSCIAFETWENRQLASRTFVVPTSDPDCDDLTPGNGECAELAWQGAVPPTLDEVSCFVRDTADPAHPYCTLGGPWCRDGRAPGGCEASTYCIPSGFCTKCDFADATSTVRDCFAAALTDGQLPISPRMACRLPVQPGSTTGELIPCAGSNVFRFGGFEPRIPQCDALELAVGPSPANGIGPFEDRVSLVTSTAIGGPQQAELKVRQLIAGCSFEMEWSGKVSNNGITAPVLAPMSLVSVTPTALGGTLSKHLLMPLSVTFVKSCAIEPTCEVLIDTDSELFNCAIGSVPQPRTLRFGERPTATNNMVTVDTFLDSSMTTTGNGNADILPVQTAAKQTVGLIRFDLAAITPGTQVISATLHLGSATPPSPGPGFSIYKMKEAWDADARWLVPRPGQTWTGASPPSREVNAEATVAPFGVGDNSILLQPALVQGWIDNPQIANFGLALATQTTAASVVLSSESAMVNLRPMLEVTLAP